MINSLTLTRVASIINGKKKAAELAASHTAPSPASMDTTETGNLSFWHDRLIEAGLIIAMALYYIVGNPNLPLGLLSHIPPLFSLPFLLVFALLCWYRLSFAIAMLPLSLPYYLHQKPVLSHYSFSLVEITLSICTGIALLRLLFRQEDRQLLPPWSAIRERLGPFIVPIVIFALFSAISILFAYARATALRAFREEVFDPLLYMVLLFTYIRSRQDVYRLLLSMLGTGLIIALLGIAQYIFFRNILVPEADGIRRVYAVYGSPNNIGILFDYALPFGLALIMGKVARKIRILALLICLPLFLVLYLSSRGSWIALACATIFIIACAMRNRKTLLFSSLAAVVVLSIALLVFHTQIQHYFIEGHSNQRGQDTITKRFDLWQSAAAMIHDSPWIGYGMDNWLCHYSNSWFNHCLYPDGPPSAQELATYPLPPHPKLHAYWMLKDPVTGQDTGMSDEPDLSHPHNVFLHVWVSIGIFGLLAFLAVLVLFIWLFIRLFAYLHTHTIPNREQLRWMLIGTGAAMLAVLVQGLGDSVFLEQDLAFCFWILVATLLLLRLFAGMPWSNMRPKALQRSTG